MRKDYAPVTSAEATADEAAYVRDYWTKKWADRAYRPDAADIGRDEVYRIVGPFLDRLPRGSRVRDGRSGGVPFKVLWRVLAASLPAAYVSHMVVAVAHRRDVRAA